MNHKKLLAAVLATIWTMATACANAETPKTTRAKEKGKPSAGAAMPEFHFWSRSYKSKGKSDYVRYRMTPRGSIEKIPGSITYEQAWRNHVFSIEKWRKEQKEGFLTSPSGTWSISGTNLHDSSISLLTHIIASGPEGASNTIGLPFLHNRGIMGPGHIGWHPTRDLLFIYRMEGGTGMRGTGLTQYDPARNEFTYIGTISDMPHFSPDGKWVLFETAGDYAPLGKHPSLSVNHLVAYDIDRHETHQLTRGINTSFVEGWK